MLDFFSVQKSGNPEIDHDGCKVVQKSARFAFDTFEKGRPFNVAVN